MSEDQLGLAFADKQTILQNYFKDTTTSFTIKSCKVTTFEEQRTGYLGDHHQLTIVINSGDNEDREITVFVKKLPTRIPKLANCLIELKAFSKETGLFRELLPRLAEFGRFAPECLFQKGDDLLVFRNVKLDGFKVLDGNRGLLNLDHLKQVLRALTRLHAASFALEAQLGKSLVEAFPAVLDENAWPNEKNHPGILELENIIGTLCAIIEFYRNAVSHSDLWNNNIMFRHDDSGIPIDCLLVDFQLARYVPPAYDFDMLIFLTTTRDFRIKHMTSLQVFYYQSLESELHRHYLDIEQVLSQQEFQESCKFYQRAGAIDSFTINHATLLPRRFLDEAFSSVEQFDRFDQKFKTKLCLETFEEDPIYRSRIVDIIETLYEAFELF
ncbi:hypothetical protein quinque_011744 [Culex quinquefasciatus]